MYFLIDGRLDTVTASKTNGDAARAALSLLGVDVGASVDPVQVLTKVDDREQRFKILNVSKMLNLLSSLHTIGMNEELKILLEKLIMSVDVFYLPKK